MPVIKTPFSPSRKATARVKNPLPAPVICRFCGGVVEIKTHEEVYGRAYGDWPYMYHCGGCGAYVGLHPFTAIPLGTLADSATREARKRCKPAFEALWRDGSMSRTQAYEWLAQRLEIPVRECHFGWFDVDRCQQAQKICSTEKVLKNK